MLVPAFVALLALAYAGGHLHWYRETPLGQVPVVDEQENLMLAEMMVRSELPREPFYRAMGYPVLLAGLRGLGVETGSLFAAALVLGILLHAVNAGLVAATAQLWFGRSGAMIAGTAYALNPVLVHYATQALDATPALTLFLLGLVWLAPELTRPPDRPASVLPWSAASVAWAAAVAFRPNYLLVWCVLPIIAARLTPRGRRIAVVAGALGGATVFVAVASWQARVSGVAGFLPWQGSYNLWAANEPGAHGRYFVQRVSVPSTVAALNPTRAESIYRFRSETGRAPEGIDDLNTHWRARFTAHVRSDPTGWIGLLARKSYALVNDWDQYNNKTFAFHQARSPWLRWNPISWGLIFVGGVFGLARMWRERPRLAGGITLVLAALAAGIVLFFVSGRFRLPLLGLATILAGGVGAGAGWKSMSPRGRWGMVGGALGAALLTGSNFGGVRDRTTFVEDHALLARAAERIGDMEQAWTEAMAALALNPNHRDAMRVAVIAYFNGLVSRGEGPGSEASWLDVSRRLLAASGGDARELQAIAALALWRAGERENAMHEWRRLGPAPSAVAARLLVGDRTVSSEELRRVPAPAWSEPLVRLAGAHFRVQPPEGVRAGDPARAAQILSRLFSASAMDQEGAGSLRPE